MRGHSTYALDRPPIVGSIGRESGQVRLRVVQRTDGRTLERHVAAYTQPEAVVNTDEWQGYNHIARARVTVNHRVDEWARDDDGDGVREVHVNTTEGLWTSLRNYLRPFRGVHKAHLSGYVAMCEHAINRKRISPDFIAALVRSN